MSDPTIENWIRKESYIKGFSKDDAFIGEIRLHNVLLSQIPAAMLLQGHNQQAIRRTLLQMIDDGFADELRAESNQRRTRKETESPRTPDTVPAAAAVEADPIVESWIRKECTRVAFSKEDAFIGEIRLHNILCNRVPASMISQGYTPQSVRRSLLKMIDDGFSEEMQQESRRRRSTAKSTATASTSTDCGPQSGIERVQAAILALSGGGNQSSDPTMVPGNSENSSPTLQFAKLPEIVKALEIPTPPFCVQHAILTTLQTTLEAACFSYSQVHCPSLLARRGWTCPHAGELNAWTKELRKSFDLGELPVSAIVQDGSRLTALLKELEDLRHTAVHRLPVTGSRLVEFINHSQAAVKMLGDGQREEGIQAIMRVVDSSFDESRRSKIKLNSALDLQLLQLEIERKKLDQRELQVRQEAENEAKVVDEHLERTMVDGLNALNLQVHAVGQGWQGW